MNRILVIGATGSDRRYRGTVGREVVSQLTAAGVPVRALTRNPDAAHFAREVDVVRGDLCS